MFLPQEPPNFLVASDFSKHVKPVAVVPDPEPEMDADNDSVDNLINTSLPDVSDRVQNVWIVDTKLSI